MPHPPGGSEDLLSAVQRECTAVLRGIGCADADRRAAALVSVIRRDYGGQTIYVPACGRREQRAAIATALAAGSAPTQIARDYGCHRTTVFRVRRARDLGSI